MLYDSSLVTSKQAVTAFQNSLNPPPPSLDADLRSECGVVSADCHTWQLSSQQSTAHDTVIQTAWAHSWPGIQINLSTKFLIHLRTISAGVWDERIDYHR